MIKIDPNIRGRKVKLISILHEHFRGKWFICKIIFPGTSEHGRTVWISPEMWANYYNCPKIWPYV